MDEVQIIRGSINGKEKYCRIPIRSKTAETMMEKGIYDLNAETILSMPRQEAAMCIDAIVYDWQYWLVRAGELFVRCQTAEMWQRRAEAAEKALVGECDVCANAGECRKAPCYCVNGSAWMLKDLCEENGGVPHAPD